MPPATVNGNTDTDTDTNANRGINTNARINANPDCDTNTHGGSIGVTFSNGVAGEYSVRAATRRESNSRFV